MASKVNPKLPTLSDPVDIEVINDAINRIANSYNQHLDETDALIDIKVTLLMQIIDQVPFFESNVSTLFTQLSSASTSNDKLVILIQIANEIALFNSVTASTLINQLNNL